MRAAMRARALTATACCTAASARRSSTGARCGGRIAWIASCSAPARRRWPARTTSRLSRRRRPSTGASSARSCAAAWQEDGDMLTFEIEADAFMRNMNRILVGTMLQVAGRRRELASFEELLRGAHRREAGPTAPPHGLYLAAVRYDEPVPALAAPPDPGDRGEECDAGDRAEHVDGLVHVARGKARRTTRRPARRPSRARRSPTPGCRASECARRRRPLMMSRVSLRRRPK